MAKKKTNGERLAIIETKLDDLTKHFENHLHLHGVIIKSCFTLAGSVIVAVICWLAKFIWNLGH